MKGIDKNSFLYPNRTIRLATSFSGIGAIEHAFYRLGLKHKIQFAGDIDSDCKKAYLANYNLSEDRWHSDIHEFDANSFKGKVDIFVGGAPCQAFSLRGKHGGFNDTRGTLFREFARVVIECQPKVFIFENVKGMLFHDKGNTWNVIKNTFEKDCGYDIHYAVLNAKNYGVPQNRERLYCIGFKNPTEFFFPKPFPLKKCVYDYLEKEGNCKYFLKSKGANFITRFINYKKSYTQINGKVLLCQKRNQQFNWHGDFIFHPVSSSIHSSSLQDFLFDTKAFETQYYLKGDLLQIESCTYPTKFTTKLIKKDMTNLTSKGIFRKLTPRECLNLMGFSKDFDIVVSDTASYKQAGNSIVVDVLMEILKQMDITKYGVENED